MSPGKTSFVKEFLNDHPQGNVKDVNDAWTAAGFAGTISTALVSKMRAHLGLAGNRRRKTNSRAPQSKSRTGMTRVTASETRASFSNGSETRGRKSNRTTVLLAVEAEIDRLIFAVMALGDLPEIEIALREARRRVYGALSP